jgi:hypothetical protein
MRAPLRKPGVERSRSDHVRQTRHAARSSGPSRRTARVFAYSNQRTAVRTFGYSPSARWCLC